jgi:molecular chaperone DnaJ
MKVTRAIDPYRVLGVARNANQATIKNAFYAAAKKYHPDVVTEKNKDIEDKFKEITLAYDILSDGILYQ